MMKTLLALMLLASPALSQAPVARAEEAPGNDVSKYTLIVSTKGREFHDVTVTHATVGTIKLVHRDGIATLSLAEMPGEIQRVFGFDAQAAAFEKVNMEDEKRRSAEAADKMRAERVALQAQQMQESQEISAIEARVVMVEYQITETQDGGCAAIVSYLVQEIVAGQKNFSGQPITRLVKRNPHAAIIHRLGAPSGTTGQTKLYPVKPVKDKAEYATSASGAWKVQHDREIEAARVKAEQEAKMLAQRKAMSRARDEAKARLAREKAE